MSLVIRYGVREKNTCSSGANEYNERLAFELPVPISALVNVISFAFLIGYNFHVAHFDRPTAAGP